MRPTPHLEKLKSALANKKIPIEDKERIKVAIERYKVWITKSIEVEQLDRNKHIEELVKLFNQYKNYIDLELIFDSKNDFLYRQKGQLKIDNSIIEEFLPLLFIKILKHKISDWEVGPINTVSQLYFNWSNEQMSLKTVTKAQDFAVAKKTLMKINNEKEIGNEKQLNIPIFVAECKTNLDKTMYQEACATSRNLKTVVCNSKYLLLCEWLDMTPGNTVSTDIDEVLILRKSKRIGSNIRKAFNTFEGRMVNRELYMEHLYNNEFCYPLFCRIVAYVENILNDTQLNEKLILSKGYF